MTNIASNIAIVRGRVQLACKKNNRKEESVLILAVSKTKPVDLIKQAYDSGMYAFGENYVQELEEKATTLSGLNITWHFIGPIQSNKTKTVAEHASFVHSVDRYKIAQRLNDQRPSHLPPLDICLQINIDNESSKAGFSIEQVEQAALQISKLARLNLRGLMAIPAPRSGPLQAEAFALLKQTLEALKTHPDLIECPLDTLSMGMSADLEAAIQEGASIVRIGTDIFGARN